MNNKEAINWLTRIRDRLMTTSSKQFEAMTIAIAALEKQERDSNKCCETCKYKNLPVSENPCDECYFASDYEDYYEAEEDNE